MTRMDMLTESRTRNRKHLFSIASPARTCQLRIRPQKKRKYTNRARKIYEKSQLKPVNYKI